VSEVSQSIDDPVGAAIADAMPASLAAKAAQPFSRMTVLAVLAGAFIAFGSIVSLVVQANMGDSGLVSLLSGIAFSVGLILVMIVGAELFTGNTMMVLPALTGDLARVRLMRAWLVVWIGNLIGSVMIAVLFAATGGMADGVGEAAIAVSESKLSKAPSEIFCSAIMANVLVCLAVWMASEAKTLPAKIMAILGPITIFVAAGLEHSIANMSLLPLGWLAPGSAPVDWIGGMSNLALSTIGNIVGGCALALGIAYGHDAIRKAK